MPSLRASDSEREEVAERLQHATLEGRLTAGELGERLEALFGSRTYGELDALVADLIDGGPTLSFRVEANAADALQAEVDGAAQSH